MRRRSRSIVIARPSRAVCAAIAFGLFGCGGDTAPASVPIGGGSVSATIDGTAWTADAASAEARHAQPGRYVLSGTKITSTSSLGIELDLYNIAAPGTYPLGVGEKVFGGVGWVTTAPPPTYWLTPFNGASGTVTVSSLTDSRIAGSFSYTAPAYTVIGDATGTRTVTNGSFDLPVRITGAVGPLPSNAGGKMSATIGGTPWNAANVTVNRTSGSVQITGDNTSLLVGINLAGVSGPGTFALAASPARMLTVTGPVTNPTGVNCCWGGSLQGTNALNDVGSITISTFSTSRIAGTFTATLAPLPDTPAATSNLVVANGSFDIGIPSP